MLKQIVQAQIMLNVVCLTKFITSQIIYFCFGLTSVLNIPADLPTTPIVSSGCVKDDIQYYEGDEIPSNCSVCFCILGGIVCADIDCDQPPLGKEKCEPQKEEGECCPSRYICGKYCTQNL